jgi:hypothetical protein
MVSRWPVEQRAVNGVSSRSTSTPTSRHTNDSETFGRSVPGRRPASQRIWNPLQIPSTGPPSDANSATAAIAGAKRAIAPQRR